MTLKTISKYAVGLFEILLELKVNLQRNIFLMLSEVNSDRTVENRSIKHWGVKA